MGNDNRREHFRVGITVPVKWNILTDDEIQYIKRGMTETLFKQGGMPSPIDKFLEEAKPGSKNEQLYLALQLLNNKLDFIIEQIMSGKDGVLSGHDDVIEISASGLKFSSAEQLEPGDLLKMELIMPGIVQYTMELIVEVLRVTENNDSYINATRIVFIKEDARDSIVKMVFQKQRIEIRNKKNLEDSF